MEGQWEEILRHGNELSGKRVRLIVIEGEATSRPNEAMLAAIEAIATIQAGMRSTSADNSEQLLREARDGKMYDLNSVK